MKTDIKKENYNKENINALPKIAILVPCYNEELTIKKVVDDFKNYPNAIVYVCDNNCTDKTIEIAKKAGATILTENKPGKGAALHTMFREIDADIYVTVDGDDTYSVKNLKDMVNLIEGGNYDMVVGDRLSSTYYVENKRPFHNFGNDLVRFLVNKLFSGNITDIMSGYRVFTKEFIKPFKSISDGFEVETELSIYALRNKYRVACIPVDYKDRIEGSSSKLKTFSDGYKVLKFIVLSKFSYYKK